MPRTQTLSKNARKRATLGCRNPLLKVPKRFNLFAQCVHVPDDAQVWFGWRPDQDEPAGVIFPTQAFAEALDAYCGRTLPPLEAPFVLSWGARGAQRACRTLEEAQAQLRHVHGAEVLTPLTFAQLYGGPGFVDGTPRPDASRGWNDDRCPICSCALAPPT